MDNMTTTTLNMVTTRTINAPIEKVWQAWSQESIVKQWWGPRKFTAPVAKMNFRVDGKSLVCMRSPEGFEIYNTWTYTEIIPLERIEFIHHFSDKDGNKLNPSAIGMSGGIPDSVPHVITLKPIGKNKTEITVTESGYTSEQVVALSKAGMDECLDKMAECLTNVG
jgi:uncharacterized protein YndB with AHSA1/START domain